MESVANGPGRFALFEADLVVDQQVARLVQSFFALEPGVDILIHCAGTISLGDVETASVGDLDRQYATNVRAPYLLTQALLPELRSNAGQIVFMNSTVGLQSKAHLSQFAATQHALKAIADSLREEVNPLGVRVVTVYPGRTASPRQERIHAIEGKPYRPERLMQPEDVASVVLTALTLSRDAELTDIRLRPMLKS